MPSFILQPDTGNPVENANAYVDVAFVDNYLDCRGRMNENEWGGASTLQKQAAIIAATDYVDKRFRFYGRKAEAELELTFRQTLSFPRDGLYEWNDETTEVITGIPVRFKNGVAEYAVRAHAHRLWQDHLTHSTGDADVDSTSHYQSTVTEGTVKKTKVDGIEREFFAPGTIDINRTFHENFSRTTDGFTADPYPEADNLFRPYIRTPTSVAPGATSVCPISNEETFSF